MKRLAVTAIGYDGHLLRAVQRVRESQALAQQLAEFSREVDQPLPTTRVTPAGDPQRLRGIPAVGGVSGTMRGTQPEGTLLAKEARGLVSLIRDVDGTSPGTQPEIALFGAC